MSEPAWVPLGPAAVLDVGPEVAYQEFTANVSITATGEPTANNIVTAPAFTADGVSSYLVEFFAIAAMPTFSGAAVQLSLALVMDGVSQGTWAAIAAYSTQQGIPGPVKLTRKVTPAAGSHVFSVKGYTASGTGTVYAGTGGTPTASLPGFIRITKVPSAVQGPSGLVPPTAIGTVLPASPVDGQEFILTDSLTAPTYQWRFRYLAAKATNKWLFIGGAPAFAEVLTLGSIAAGAYGVLSGPSPGPAITLPVAGDYDVTIGFRHETQTAQHIAFMSYDIGATPAVDADSCEVLGQTGANAAWNDANRTRRKSGLGAVTLTAKYKSGSGTMGFSRRWMEVEPVAVGG